ncbi:hypothetical protein OF829_07755 [Sphingomonas sp. LB-2]|uniref:hypothetical protein n=1 Tax=Sphingomonas caeni TaxID=2984949 RepID=UPI00222E1BB7|nr:hypothetical protein [Sphingomonas caeni]MCW3847131.1 hypothetical protein [Sphingomonas caeni]
MRLKLLFAALLALLPVPALADVTAHYVAGPKDPLVIEVADGGNARFSIGDKFAVIRRDGVDYVLVANATGGFSIAKLADVLELISGQMKSGGIDVSVKPQLFELSAGGEESVAGYSGMVWTLAQKPSAPGKGPGDPIDVVISADPALAPVGTVFHHLIDVMNPIFRLVVGDTGNLGRLLGELTAKGTPLRVGPILALDSVSNAEIGAERFELPGTVLEPMEFLAAVSPAQSGAGMPPLP